MLEHVRQYGERLILPVTLVGVLLAWYLLLIDEYFDENALSYSEHISTRVMVFISTFMYTMILFIVPKLLNQSINQSDIQYTHTHAQWFAAGKLLKWLQPADHVYG